jgi:hypothetical protein
MRAPAALEGTTPLLVQHMGTQPQVYLQALLLVLSCGGLLAEQVAGVA